MVFVYPNLSCAFTTVPFLIKDNINFCCNYAEKALYTAKQDSCTNLQNTGSLFFNSLASTLNTNCVQHLRSCTKYYEKVSTGRYLPLQEI